MSSNINDRDRCSTPIKINRRNEDTHFRSQDDFAKHKCMDGCGLYVTGEYFMNTGAPQSMYDRHETTCTSGDVNAVYPSTPPTDIKDPFAEHKCKGCCGLYVTGAYFMNSGAPQYMYDRHKNMCCK
jgi:hypothetical protein